MGEFGARKMKQQNKDKRWKKISYITRVLKLRERKDPMEGAPQAKGIVLSKIGKEQKQPSSGIIKCVRVQLLKNGKELTAFCPGNGLVNHINEHDEVLVEGLGGSQHGPIGTQHGVKWKVSKVNNIPVRTILAGKGKKAA